MQMPHSLNTCHIIYQKCSCITGESTVLTLGPAMEISVDVGDKGTSLAWSAGDEFLIVGFDSGMYCVWTRVCIYA